MSVTRPVPAPVPSGPGAAAGITWNEELRETYRLAWPLVLAQLAGMAIVTTDVVMMGWLGPRYLAAGTLATSFLMPLFLFGVGVAGAVAPLAAQALGARDPRSVRRAVRQGFWVAIAISTLLIPLVLQAGAVWRRLGQDPEIAALAMIYLTWAVWHVLPALLIIVLRSFLAALGDTRIILWITIGGIFVNAASNYTLMFGNFGAPRLELVGAGITTTIINALMFAAMLVYAVTHRRHRRYAILGRFWRADWQTFGRILRIGTPIGLMIMAEVGLFTAAVILIGWLGTDELAAHAIAIQCASIAFMVPLGVAQAATIRVGLAYGAGSGQGVARAGWTSIAIGTGFMVLTCALFILAPGPLVALFLDPADPANAAALALAASYLAVAGLFQVVDGGQVVAAGALRGLSDTAMPMLIAVVGYWLVGLPVSYLLGIVLGFGGVGVWLGLAAGLAFVAMVLIARFALRERLGLLRRLETAPA